jgi:phosphatidylserine decarboxylase
VTARALISSLTQQEQLNFLLTNRIPRRWATLFMGRFSRIENPLIRSLSIGLWKLFADDLRLDEARKSSFRSLHDCFIRELKPGARPVDKRAEIVTSPCDAIIGAHGDICGTEVYQAKGFPYSLMELLNDPLLVERYRDGLFVTLRLKSNMYHRFHAPTDCRVTGVTYISGDTWNVNPIALKRVERLYCKNERAVIDLQLAQPDRHITLVPVAAILVASIRLHCLDQVLDLQYQGPNHLPCDARYAKGEEMGYFQHGSTIILFCTSAFQFCEHLREGDTIRMGQALLEPK